MDVKIKESIEEIIQKHVARMQSIPGHSDYKFDKLDLIMYLASEEAKAKSPPVIMHRNMKDITLGTVYGPCEAGKSDTEYCPNNEDYTAFVEK